MRRPELLAILILSVLASSVELSAQTLLDRYLNDNGKSILLICYPFADDFTQADRDYLRKCLDGIPCRDERVSLIFIPYRKEDCASCSTVASGFGGRCVCMDEAHRRGYGLRHAPSYNLLEPSGVPSPIPSNQLTLDRVVESMSRTPGTFTIEPSWWTKRADMDGDGYYGSGCVLHWDANVSDGYRRSVGVKVLWRLRDGTAWQLLDSVAQYTISGDQTIDAASVPIPPTLQRGYYDFRLEIYPCGESRPAVSREPESDPALFAVPIEPSPKDVPRPKPAILDAFWSDLRDADGDGFYRAGAKLTWVTSIADIVPHRVEARIYADTNGHLGALPIASLAYDCSEDGDSASIALPELDPQRYDFRIKVFDSSDVTLVCDYSSEGDPDLMSVPLEPPADDSPLYHISGLRWQGLVDEDGDGYYREGMSLLLDMDVSEEVAHQVRAVVSQRVGPAASWVECAATRCFDISDSDTNDRVLIPISGCELGQHDFRVDVYACEDSAVLLATTGPAEYQQMSYFETESIVDDELTPDYSIGSVHWSRGRDSDHDGYSTGGDTLTWDPDVDGYRTRSVFTQVYWRVHGTQAWNLLGRTEDNLVVGATRSDTMSVVVSSLSHGEYDFGIALFESGMGDTIAWIGPEQEQALSARLMEIASEDKVTPNALISDASWSGRSDQDGDGYYSEDMSLALDLAVDHGEGLSIQAAMYYRQSSGSDWQWLATSQCTPTAVAGNRLLLQLAWLRRSTYDFRIDISDCASHTVLASRAPSDDPDLSEMRLEPRDEDKRKVSWPAPRRNSRVFAGVSGGVHMIRIREDSRDTWKGLAAIGLQVRQTSSIGLEVTAFYSDSVRILEGGIAGFDFAPSLLTFGDAFSVSLKAGAMWLCPNRIGPEFLRLKIDYVSPYAGGGVFIGAAGSDPTHRKLRLGVSAYAIYSEEKKYYKTSDFKFPGDGRVDGIVTLGGLSGGATLQLEF